jgi:hypothetical protein
MGSCYEVITLQEFISEISKSLGKLTLKIEWSGLMSWINTMQIVIAVSLIEYTHIQNS